MSRIKLKCGGKPRHKAFFGADGTIMAAATLAAAGMQVGATVAAAKSQAKAVESSAKTQAQSIKDQTTNSNNLQKEQLAFTRSQNQENRQQQQDIQATLQMLAGQENMNDRMEANKMQVKYGGKPKRTRLSTTLPYGGGKQVPFQVTDGGGVIPIAIDPSGYGLYELVGNDHEHSHKAPGGKRKTGVGIKFNNGEVVEGEGNQNSNQGELLYVTPQDAMFLSKHSIAGFNPTKAVLRGMHPVEAFNAQEIIKDREGFNDDGSRRRRSLGGFNVLDPTNNLTQLPSNGTAGVAGGTVYAIKPIEETSTPVARLGCRKTLKCGGSRRKAAWGDYAAPTYNAIGNLLGAGLTTWGNMYASKILGKAYGRAGDILADAYSQMHGIDMNELKMEDYAAPHTLAVVRDANNISYDPQRERIRRNSASERREINLGTLSSAARQQRLAATNDRMMQRISEIDSAENNAREPIRQGNAERITQTVQANADRDVQASRDFNNQRLSFLQYNNNIENAKRAGIGQARADALTQSSMAHSQGMQTSMTAIGNALGNAGQGFASAFDTVRKNRTDFTNTYIGLGNEDQVKAAILRYKQTGDKSFINGLLAGSTISDADRAKLNEVLTKKKKR